ncbi:hypothetical protein FRC03_001120 [Tulasnella sp. 419]|nr:hypothetical protein FRC02_005837 [Tulasnella sp. 418]KAG8964969.1 hypothetical protein FRC03_001120 [Tulasnella sp. 419]
MLFLVRYIIIFAIVAIQAINATLAVGNFASGAELDQFFAINTFVCLFGILVLVFVGLLMVVEHLQGERTTTAIGFELLWSLAIWVASAVEASYTSSVRPAVCLESHKRDVRWDACAISSGFVSLSWLSMFFAMGHIALLLLVVEWHHNCALTSHLKLQPSTPWSADSRRLSFARRASLALTDVVRGEISILFPILRRSARVLFREKDRGKTWDTETDTSAGYVTAGGQRLHLQIAKKKKGGSSSSSFACSSSPRLLDLRPHSPIPFHDVRAKPVSVPIDCHPDNIDESKFVIVPETVPVIRIHPSTPMTGNTLPTPRENLRSSMATIHSPIRSGPRTPKRSLTLPSSPSYPRNSWKGNETVPQVALSRSHTFTSTGRFIPSRYMGLDLSSYTSSPLAHVPQPPVGHLPNPNGVYV